MTPGALDALPASEQAEMAGYVAWRASLCVDCGVAADLALDDSTVFTVTDEDCWGCRLRTMKERQLQEAYKDFPTVLAGKKVWISEARRGPRPEAVT